jgi:HD-GYP domain-containing protein (c-di-GMP phosphodiesterase class II)
MLNIRKAKHLMQKAVDSIMQNDSALLGLANIKNYDEYTFNHSVNVAIYALALGQRIGLPKKNSSPILAWLECFMMSAKPRFRRRSSIRQKI